MRIGLFGGTFDPVHIGHLILAESARELCGLDEIRFIPAKSPPHKQGKTITPAKLRIEMLEFALAGCTAFRIDKMEIKRDGPSYTVDTLRILKEQEPEHEFSLIIGADSLDDLPTWKEPAEILRLANVIAVNRGRESASMENIIEAVGKEACKSIECINMPGIDLSASEIRKRVQTGKSIRFQTLRSVELYIATNELYREKTSTGV